MPQKPKMKLTGAFESAPLPPSPQDAGLLEPAQPKMQLTRSGDDPFMLQQSMQPGTLAKPGGGWAALYEALTQGGDLMQAFTGVGLGAEYEMMNLGTKAKPVYQTVATSMAPIPAIGPRGFFSQAEKVLQGSKQGIYTGPQLVGFLKSRGVKEEELKWSGLLDLAKNPKVSREEALLALKKAPRVSEIVLGAKNTEIRAAENRAYKAGVTWSRADQNAYVKYGPDSNAWPREVHEKLGQLWQEREDAYALVEQLGDQRTAQYSPDKHPEWNLPGKSKNYKEILLTLDDPFAKGTKVYEVYSADSQAPWFTTTRKEEAEQFVEHSLTYKEPFSEKSFWTIKERVKPPEPKFSASHHGEDDVLAHIRMDERRLADDPNEVMDFVEEFQSDWQNVGLKKGFKETNPAKLDEIATNEHNTRLALYKSLQRVNNLGFNFPSQAIDAIKSHPQDWWKLWDVGNDLGVKGDANRWLNAEHARKIANQGQITPGPFVESGSWGELAVKRALLESAQNPNSTHFGWTTGKQQIERSTDVLRMNVDHIQWSKAPSDKAPRVNIKAFKQGREVFNQTIPKEGSIQIGGKDVTLDNVIDKSWGQRFRSEASGSVKGDDLHVGGAGKIQAYDVARKAEVKRLTKQEPKLIDIEGGAPTTYSTLNLAEYKKTLRVKPQKVWGIKWTPELRERIIKEGFPLYTTAPLMLSLRDGADTKPLPLPPPPPLAEGVRSLGQGLPNDSDRK